MIKRALNMTEEVLKNGRSEIFGILKTIKERKFEGNRGLAIKNSLYQIATSAISKGGGIIFTIILARLLLPELFGLYSLALATILVFASLSDLGLGSTLIRFVSSAVNKHKEKEARAYFIYLLKIKSSLSLVVALILIILAKFLANNYYQKPIYLALLAGSIYVLCAGFVAIFDAAFQSVNNFKQTMLRESIFQLLRLTIIPIFALYFLKSYSGEIVSSTIILILALSYLVALIFLIASAINKLSFLKADKTLLNSLQRKKVNMFWIFLSTTILSGIFIGYVDTIMLGHFVDAESIGFYQAALTLVSSIFPLIPISTVLLPIFSRLRGKKLEQGFERSRRFTLFVSLGLFILTLLLAKPIIEIIYGTNYLPSINILRLLSIILLVLPISMLYDSYFISIGKPQVMAKYLLISTALNIVLNYLLIVNLMKSSSYLATLGSALAVVVSRTFYLIMQLIIKAKD